MKRARPYDREAALDAALNLFWTKGYHATSLKDLEAALNMKPGSIYAAFSSKEALYLAALERYSHLHRDRLRKLGEEAGSPLKALADLMRNVAQCSSDDPDCRPCMLIKTLVDVTTDDDQIARQSRQYLDEVRNEVAALFALAKSKGELPPDADPLRLAQRYQSELSALKIEAHCATDREGLLALAEDMAQQFEQLRVPPSNSTKRSKGRS